VAFEGHRLDSFMKFQCNTCEIFVNVLGNGRGYKSGRKRTAVSGRGASALPKRGRCRRKKVILLISLEIGICILHGLQKARPEDLSFHEVRVLDFAVER
jgi:hypothetical protein